ncbi:hypothetical protein PCANC_27734 [Puccinia coronata f. sp. avenae]|uniref:Uncharacterized protein n=1 Tax=Puccinia coronata f. sp. avenae TaxID=200324 RepID=A0A2N5RV83_9BASI|nr:hypothetical protein PCANC_27734 [Puccinia coronata f. sp. avenae]
MAKQENHDEFKVRMKQPTTIDRLLELDVAALISEIRRLEDSVERLVRSNQEIWEFLEEDGSDAESNHALVEAREENLVTIETQKERIEMIKWCVARKTRRDGVDNPHYQLSHPHSTSSPAGPIPTISTPEDSMPEASHLSGVGGEAGISL